MDSSETKPEHEVSLLESSDGEATNLLKLGQDPTQLDEHKVQANYVSRSFIGIALAGSAYPFFLGVVFFFYRLFNPSILDLPATLFILVIYALIGGFFGFLIAGIVGGLAILLVIVINRSLGYPFDAQSAAISAGSLAGFASTVWILFAPGFRGDLVETATAALLGPILAMALGAIGAAKTSSVVDGLEFSIATRPRKHKLSILHLMVATAWIAVILAIANSFGGPEFAIAVVGWLVLQAFMLGFISAIRKLRKPAPP